MPAITPGGTLTLDLAGTVGWAYGPLSATLPIFGHWRKPKFGGEGAFYAAFENTLAAHIDEVQPSAIVLEAALDLRAQTQNSIMRQQITLRGIGYMLAYRASVRISEIDAYTARLEVLGTGWFRKGQAKIEVVKHIRARGCDISVHDEADACVLWWWHKQRLTGAPRVAGPLWRDAIEREPVRGRA